MVVVALWIRFKQVGVDNVGFVLPSQFDSSWKRKYMIIAQKSSYIQKESLVEFGAAKIIKHTPKGIHSIWLWTMHWDTFINVFSLFLAFYENLFIKYIHLVLSSHRSPPRNKMWYYTFWSRVWFLAKSDAVTISLIKWFSVVYFNGLPSSQKVVSNLQ